MSLNQKVFITAAMAMIKGHAEHHADMAELHASTAEALASAITRGDVRGPSANAFTGLLDMSKLRDDFALKMVDTEAFKLLEGVVKTTETLVAGGMDLEDAFVSALDHPAGEVITDDAFSLAPGELDTLQVQGEGEGINQADGGASIDTEAGQGKAE